MPRITNLGDLEITGIPHPGQSEAEFRITLDHPLDEGAIDKLANFTVKSDGTCVIDRNPSMGESSEHFADQPLWVDHVKNCEHFLEIMPHWVKHVAQVLACYATLKETYVETRSEPNVVYVRYLTKELIRKPAKFTADLAARLGRAMNEADLSKQPSVTR